MDQIVRECRPKESQENICLHFSFARSVFYPLLAPHVAFDCDCNNRADYKSDTEFQNNRADLFVAWSDVFGSPYHSYADGECDEDIAPKTRRLVSIRI